VTAALGALGLCAGWAAAGYAGAQGCRLPRWLLAAGPGLLWALLAWRWGWSARWAVTAPLALGLWTAASIDLHTYRIPNAVPAALLLLGVAAQLSPRPPFAAALPSALAGLGAGALFAALALLSRGGFGWGDAKLAGALAFVLGPAPGALALAGTALAGGLAAAALLVTRRRGPRDALPFAPFFLVGGLLAVLEGVHR